MMHFYIYKSEKKTFKEVGMACQKACKHFKDNIKAKIVYKALSIPIHLFLTSVQWRAKKKMQQGHSYVSVWSGQVYGPPILGY